MKKYIQAEHVKMFRRMNILHLLIGIPTFEFGNLTQCELIKFKSPDPEDMVRNTWIDRQMRFFEKRDRQINKWVAKAETKKKQLSFDEVFDQSLHDPSPQQSTMAHVRNREGRIRNGKHAIKPLGLSRNLSDECPDGPYFAEICSRPRREFWQLKRLGILERAEMDHHIAGEVARGEWD